MKVVGLAIAAAVISAAQQGPVFAEPATGEAAIFPQYAGTLAITMKAPGLSANPLQLTLPGSMGGCAPVSFDWRVTDPSIHYIEAWLENGALRLPNSGGSLLIYGDDGVPGQTGKGNGLAGTASAEWCSGPGDTAIELTIRTYKSYPNSGTGDKTPTEIAYRVGTPIVVTMDASSCAPLAQDATAGQRLWASQITGENFNEKRLLYLPVIRRYDSVVRLPGQEQNCAGEAVYWYAAQRSGAGAGYLVLDDYIGINAGCSNANDSCFFTAFGKRYNLTDYKRLRSLACRRVSYAPRGYWEQLCIPIPSRAGTYYAGVIEGFPGLSVPAAPPKWVCTYGNSTSSCQWVFGKAVTLPPSTSSVTWRIVVGQNSVRIQRS